MEEQKSKNNNNERERKKSKANTKPERPHSMDGDAMTFALAEPFE